MSGPGELPDAADLEAARSVTDEQRALRVEALAMQTRLLLSAIDEAQHTTDVRAVLRLVARLIAEILGVAP